MKHKKLVVQIASMILIHVLIVGCSATAVSPTPIIIVVTATPQPTSISSSATPLSIPPEVPPTSRPTITSTKTSTPTTVILPHPSAIVVTKEGTTFEITNARIEEFRSANIGFQKYPQKVDGLEVYQDLTTISIPFDKIERIEKGNTQGKNHTTVFVITLLGGGEVEGELGRGDEGDFRNIALHGNTVVHGYPSEFNIDFDSVSSVVLTHDEQGIVLADITTEDDSITRISEPWCMRAPWSPFSGTSIVQVIKFQIGNNILEIPLADVAKIMVSEKGITLTLLDNEELEGQIPQGTIYYVSGESAVAGFDTFFHASLLHDIISIGFDD